MSAVVINNLEIEKRRSLVEVHETAMTRFRQCEVFESTIRDEALEDLRFANGDQWLSEDIIIRRSRGRPILTFNRMAAFLDQIVGDQQQAVFNISVAPISYRSLKFTPDDIDVQYSLAQVYDGYIKDVGRRTSTRRARNMAFEYQTSCGFGYYRVYADYIGEMSFDQDINVLPIANPFTVYLDPIALFRGPEYAQYGFIFDAIPNSEYQQVYGKSGSGEADRPAFGVGDVRGTSMEGWYLEDAVRVCEYFVKRFVKTEVVQLNDGNVYKMSNYIAKLDQFEQSGLSMVRSKMVNLPQVFWYLMDGQGIIKGPKEFPSKYIPIIPVYGKMRVVDGEVHLRGAGRFARDAQRLYNYSETTTAELITNAPKNQWVIDWDAVPEVLREDYKKAQLDHLPALYYSSKGGNAPTREQPATIQPGFAQLTERAWENLKGTFGQFNDALGDIGPAVSAKAINSRISESDTISFPFISNFTMSLEYEAKVVLDMMPRILDSQRVLKIINSEDAEVYLTINRVEWDPVSKTWKILNELSHTDVSIFVQAGPSAKTQRMEATEVMSNALRDVGQAEPRVIPILLKQIAMNGSWTGARDFARVMDRMIAPELRDIGQEKNNDSIPKEMLPQLIAQGVQAALKDAGVELEQFSAQTDRIKVESDRIRALIDVYEARIKEFEATVKAKEVGVKAQLPAGPNVT